MQHKKQIGILLVGLLLTAVFLGGCAGNQENTGGTADTVTAFIGDLAANATAAGTVQPQQEATLSTVQPGRVEYVAVQVGEKVASGEVLVQLETTDLGLSVATAAQNLRLQEANLSALRTEPRAAEIAAAAAAVSSAQENLDALLAGPAAAEIAAAEADLNAATANVRASSAQVAQTESAVTASDIAAAEASLAAAAANLKSVELTFTRNPDPDDIAANTALAQAREQVAAAEARLNNLRAGPDASQVGAARANLSASAAQRDATAAQLDQLTGGAAETEIASARAQLAQAQASLDGLRSGPRSAQIVAAEADVTQARLNLADAEASLADATITAPFAGVITAVYVSPGEFASGSVIDIANDNRLEVILEVDEVDIGAISLGQEAAVTLEAWPGDTIPTEVVAIAPSAQEANAALVTYDVHLAFSATDRPVLIGMTANANLVTAEREAVLLVPNAAITVDRVNGLYFVQRLTGETTEEVEITVGLRDSQFTQVTGGLSEGDELLLRTAQTNNFGPPDGPFARDD